MAILYSQAQRLNSICINNELFDKRCDDLKKYLLERSYSDKMVHAKILGARAIPRDAHLEKVNIHEKQGKIIFNITH